MAPFTRWSDVLIEHNTLYANLSLTL